MFIYLFLVQDELETSIIILPMRLCDTGDLILIKIKELTPPDDIFRSKGLKKNNLSIYKHERDKHGQDKHGRVKLFNHPFASSSKSDENISLADKELRSSQSYRFVFAEI